MTFFVKRKRFARIQKNFLQIDSFSHIIKTMIDIFVLIQTMAELFILLIIGFDIGRRKKIDESATNQISWLIANVLNPCLIIAAVLSNTQKDKSSIVSQAIWMGWLIYILLILIAEIFFYFKKEEHSIYKLLCIFANTGFIGYPIIRALYGDFAMFVFSILHMPFNAVFYLYGVHQVNKEAKFHWKQIVNPGLIFSILGLLIYFFHWSIPEVLAYVCTQLGNASIPLSMLVIGLSLSFIPLETVFKNRKLLFYTGLKLLGFPLLFFLFAKVMPCSSFMKQLLVLSGTLPAAAMTSIIANQYNYHSDLASAGVFLTTLGSVLTIPILCTILFPML